jgi:hypothetical protein
VAGSREAPLFDEAGGERMVLEGDAVRVDFPDSEPMTIPLTDLVETVHHHGVRGLDEEPLADCVRWRIECGALTVFIVELKPMVRAVTWIDPKSEVPFGEEATYRTYRLETPFVVLKVPFLRRQLVHMCELFYRTAPLKRLDDELLWPNLLNVSPAAYGCTAWLCTQNLGHAFGSGVFGFPSSHRRARRAVRMVDQLDAVVTHLWNGGFNRSSEAHEGSSAFEKAVRERVDKRLAGVEQWQQASLEEPGFTLEVKWKETGLTVRKLIEQQLGAVREARRLDTAAEVVSALLGRNRRKTGQP